MTGPRGDMAPIVGGLGEKVKRQDIPPPEWVQIPGRPGWWKDRHGMLKYVPPLP